MLKRCIKDWAVWWRVVVVLSASPRRPGRPQGSPLRVVILPSEGIPGLGWCFDGCYVAVVGFGWVVGDLGGAAGVGYVGFY